MKITRKLKISLFLVVVPCLVSAQDRVIAQRLEAYIAPFIEAGHFAGVVLAAKGGRVVFEKAFGYAQAEFKIPNGIHSRIGIASITKPMTQIILSRLIEANNLALSDTIGKFFPGFPDGGKITVEMLAKHRAGIPHRVMLPAEEAVPHTSEEMAEKIAQTSLLFEPGTQSQYSSAGYTLLARVMELASGRNYAELLQEYVFTPANMSESVDFNGDILIMERSQDYLLDASGIINAPLKDYSFLVGAGSVFSTARDVYRFGEAVTNGAFGETVRSSFVRDNVFSSNGRTNGHRAFLKIDVNKDYGYVLLSNLASGANEMILANMDAILEGSDVPPAEIPNPKNLQDSSTVISDYLGSYQRQGGGSALEVRVKNNVLLAGDIRLYPTRTDCFFDYLFYGNVCFVRDSLGTVKELRWDGPTFALLWTKQ